MATPATSVREFCTLLAKSKLLPADEVESIHRRWREETRGTDDQVEAFRKHIVSRRAITEWQAHMVQRGRADGFFIGGYKILDRIGKGQMGGVYKAVHTLGQIVALKILPSSKARDQHVLGRFQREARLLTQLDHPNVVRAYQVGEANGVHFIGMEFLEGETLDEVLSRRKRLPWQETVRLIYQTFNGLQHLYDKRMIHRDLKPTNLMLTPASAGKHDTTWEATVKVLDIGLGREMFADETPEGQIETQLTVEGAVLGTPDYLAPEQAKDARTADIRADIYSLGCVLYHCISGRPPFAEGNIMTQMLKHATEKPPSLAAFVPDLPQPLLAVIDRFLAKSPDERYPTPAAAAAALKPFLAPSGATPTAAPLVPAFREWLETESQMELTLKLPPTQLPAAAPKPPAAPAKPPVPVPVAAPPKPGTAPAPTLPKPGTAPAPSLPATPQRPAAAPMKPGTATAPALTAPAAKSPSPSTNTPRPPQRPVAKPVVPGPAIEEVDVELVADPGAVMVPVPFGEPPVKYVKVKDERGLTEFDRRDWIMLASGAAGVLVAVGLGYGLARLMRKKPEEPPPEE